MRKEFCEKDGILITYTEDDVCFEDCKTAEAILLKNDGSIIHSNFDDEKNNAILSPILMKFNAFPKEGAHEYKRTTKSSPYPSDEDADTHS